MDEPGLYIFVEGPISEGRIKETCSITERSVANSELVLTWTIGASVINVMVKALYFDLGTNPPREIRKHLRMINSMILEKGYEPLLQVQRPMV